MVSPTKKIYLLVASQPLDLIGKDWLKQMPELGIIANIEPVFIFKNPAADITPAVWLKLAQEIHKRLSQANGFVILHGIDNLLYTASALSFLLQNLTKPIIFTGGQFGRPDNKRLDIRANLINAAQATNYNLTEVCLMFGNRLLRANQASKATEESLNIFTTPQSGVLGRIDFSIRIFEKIVLQNKGKTKLFDKLSDKVEIIDISPTLNLKALTRRLAEKVGVIVNAGAYQSLPTDLMFLLEKITADIPVVIWSKQITDSAIAPKNIILINNLTWETTVTKFMWAVAQGKSLKKIKELMSKDIAGEFLS